jgi:outer membrane protein
MIIGATGAMLSRPCKYWMPDPVRQGPRKHATPPPWSWLAFLLTLLAGCSPVTHSWIDDHCRELLHPEDMRSRLLGPPGDPALPSLDNPAELPPSADSPPAPQSPAATVFSLAGAVDFGLHNSPRLKAALAAIERARSQEQVAFAPFLPQIDFLSHSGITSRALGPNSAGQTGIILADPTGSHPFSQAELQLQWIICDFGRTSGRFRQAVAREQIAELQYARAKETVAFDIAAAYLQAQRAGAVRVIQEDAIRRAEATLKDVRSRRAAGVAEKDDVLRAEVQLSFARDAVAVAEEAELAARARLNNVMGRNASWPIELVDAEAQPAFSLSLGQSLEIAAAQRREIGIARQAVAAARSGWQATAAEYLPRVYTLGSVGGVTGDNLAEGWQEGIGIHIDMPLFTGGRRRGEQRAADADVQEALANAQAILDQVSLEVTLAYRSAVTAKKRIGYLRPAIAEARENLRLVGNRYRNGNATPTDIVDAETALTGAQQRLSSATYEYLAALARLDYALGNVPGCLLTAAPEELAPPPRPVEK